MGIPTKVSKSEISIHALREEGDRHADDCCLVDAISIHALREEGDQAQLTNRRLMRISIHALREEGDRRSCISLVQALIFLSTPSARRATGVGRRSTGRKQNFYPRPPRGGRHSYLAE